MLVQRCGLTGRVSQLQIATRILEQDDRAVELRASVITRSPKTVPVNYNWSAITSGMPRRLLNTKRSLENKPSRPSRHWTGLTFGHLQLRHATRVSEIIVNYVITKEVTIHNLTSKGKSPISRSQLQDLYQRHPSREPRLRCCTLQTDKALVCDFTCTRSYQPEKPRSICLVIGNMWGAQHV